jgi:hypothetical protein
MTFHRAVHADKDYSIALGRLASFLVPWAVVTAYTLNNFYVAGGRFWDDGLFAYFAAFTDEWPMLMPDVQHRDAGMPRDTFFRTHFMPFFYLTSALYKLISFIPPAAYLSILQGVWTGLLGLSAFIVCEQVGIALALAVSASTALCGPTLGALGFPHVELAIPGLLALFFSLRIKGRDLGAYTALALCLMIREDAGLHASGVLVLLSIAQWLAGEPIKEVRRNVLIACVCFGYAVLALGLQFLVYPAHVSSLERQYLGRPIWAHLTWQLIVDRIPPFFTGYAYAAGPLLILMMAALWKRNLRLLVGALAPVPWIVLSLVAVGPQVGLGAYYSFPLIIGLAWPTIAKPNSRFAAVLQLIMASVSIVLFAAWGAPDHDNAPWKRFWFTDFSRIGRYEAVLREAVSHRTELGRLMLDDAVVAFIPEAAMMDEWSRQWAVDRLPNPEVMIYFAAGRDSAETRRVIEESGLTYRCNIPGTPFVVASRKETGICRNPP